MLDEKLHSNNSKLETFLEWYVRNYLGRSPAFPTSDDFVRSNEIIRTKWLIY